LCGIVIINLHLLRSEAMACSQIQKLESEVSMNASAEKFYDILCNKTHQLPKISPQNLLSVQIHKGQWGTQGSIISWNYLHGMSILPSIFYH